ncbi:MAG: hypothetical protein QOK15_3865 [Nocardioidaceae bacterium]|nr:hypothetical protein [Nocardioidaceae bacterium]
MRTRPRRALLGLLTGALLAGGSFAAPAQAAPRAATRDVTRAADSAADWLASQLGADHLVVSGYNDGTQWVTYTDYGLTLDFFFAFKGLGVRKALRGDILDAIEPQTGAYVGTGATAYAGAIGKLLTAVEVQHRDPHTYSSRDLVTKLEGLVHKAKDGQRGRAKDTWDPSDSFGKDNSNTIGQSWVVRALVGSDSAQAHSTVKFLLKQQCAGGWFRVSMSGNAGDFTCDGGTPGDSKRSVDATAFALEALQIARTAGVRHLRDDIRDAAAWLVRRQAANGSFSDAGDANANSTGVAAEALAMVGKDRAARQAAGWLHDHQVTRRVARTTALHGEKGAVAYDHAALKAGRADDITRGVRYQWRRATAQAAVGLDSLGG